MTGEEIKGTMEHYLTEAMLGNFDEESIHHLAGSMAKALTLQGVVIKVDRDMGGCGCEICLEGTGLSREIVESLISK